MMLSAQNKLPQIKTIQLSCLTALFNISLPIWSVRYTHNIHYTVRYSAYVSVTMLRANSFQFTFSKMNIQCWTVRLSRENAALLIPSFYIHEDAQTCIWFSSSDDVWLQSINRYCSEQEVSVSAVTSHSCIRAGLCPLVNWGMISSHDGSNSSPWTCLGNTLRRGHVACYCANQS